MKIGFLSILCISLIVLSGLVVLGGVADEGPRVIDCRKLTFYEAMESRLEAYEETHDWRLKVHPSDLEYLENVTAETVVYVEAYVSNPREATEYSIDLSTNETIGIYHVYQARGEQVEAFLKIPQESPLYKSKFDPSICMEIEAKYLEEIAELPFVYCIRVGPTEVPIETPDELFITSGSVTIEEARSYNYIKYVLENKDSTVDYMQIAIIDTGYDPSDSGCKLGGVAEDNILYHWDFQYDNSDVTDGDNHHGTNVLDLIARAFGDTGEDDSMYEFEYIYYVLKIGKGLSCNTKAAKKAIEWCLSHDPEVVSMSWGFGFPFGPSFACTGLWCDLFKEGVQLGITWVAASGNQRQSNAVLYPSASYYVIGVGGYESGFWRWTGWFPGQGSNYGTIYYSKWQEWGFEIYCSVCYEATGDAYVTRTVFKPDCYDAAKLAEGLTGTSFSAPLAAACIAMGVYSAKHPSAGQDWIPGYSNVRSAVHSCHTYLVKPDASSLAGDVINCLTLYNNFH
ncbi:hypothetical protein CW700_07530 [Candidatus Bathyarchaeota archaeon]|nr:MAG: hypothetical protein CW700_07530 [Candidatus Bathyarchaeota archaeon]